MNDGVKFVFIEFTKYLIEHKCLILVQKSVAYLSTLSLIASNHRRGSNVGC